MNYSLFDSENFYIEHKDDKLTGWEKFALLFILPFGIFLAVVPAEWIINLGVNLLK